MMMFASCCLSLAACLIEGPAPIVLPSVMQMIHGSLSFCLNMLRPR